MFNKGEYVGHLEPTIEDIKEEKNLHFQANPDAHTANSTTTQRMMSEQIEPEACEPLHHKLKPSIETKLLKEYASQFTQDETSISTTPLTEKMIDKGNSEPVSQKPYPITMRHYQRVKDKIEKLLTAKLI